MTLAEQWKQKALSLYIKATNLLKQGSNYQRLADETGISVQEIQAIKESI